MRTSKKRSLWFLIRRLLFIFDAEKVHRVALRVVVLIFRVRPRILATVSGMPKKEYCELIGGEFDPIWVSGVSFLSRVGLAAGFDKNAEIVSALPCLGFGFAEIGTVTPRPQSGNEMPRLFRVQKSLALFNRMGFNNDGAIAIAKRLEIARKSIPEYFRVGVNIGKNRSTPLESAASDYSEAARCFNGLADYFVINVSSPNTPRLRALQTQARLQPIVESVHSIVSKWSRSPLLFLKLGPEVQGSDLEALVLAAEAWSLDGWVLTNTLAGELNISDKGLKGGFSGAPLREKARKSLKTVKKLSAKPVISVGGIISVDEAKDRIGLGADLVQIYSGWIFEGPTFPYRVSSALKGS